MSWTKVTEVWEDDARAGTSDVIEATRRFTAVNSTYVRAMAAVYADDGTTAVPLAGSAHPDDTDLIAWSPTVKRRGRSNAFDIVVPYRTKDSGLLGDNAIHPLSRPATWSEAPKDITAEVDTDSANRILKTSAGQVLTTQIPWGDKVLTAVLNESSWNDYDGYRFKINSSSVTLKGKSYDAKTVLCLPVRKQEMQEIFQGSAVDFVQVTFTFLIVVPRPGGNITTWNYRIMDRGTLKKDAESGKAVAIMRNGAAITSAVPLDGSGGELASGADPWIMEGTGWSQNPSVGRQMFAATDLSSLPVAT